MKVTIDVRQIEITFKELVDAYAEATGVKYASDEELDYECFCEMADRDSCFNDGLYRCTMTREIPEYFKNRKRRKDER